MLAAYSLDQRGYHVTLLEQKQRGGGLIKTTRAEHGIAESAAHSLITTDAVRELCRDLCVELIEPRRESRTKFIVRNGQLVRFPLNVKEALNLAGHIAFTKSTGANEPVDAWARRHLGDSGTEYLLTPFVRGIYGVQPKELGVTAAFPFLNLPQGQTLLSAAAHRVFSRSKKKKSRAAPRDGMGELVGKLERRLEERLGMRFRKQEQIQNLPDGPNVIIATPAYTARLLQPHVPQLADALRSVNYTPIVSVTTFVDN